LIWIFVLILIAAAANTTIDCDKLIYDALNPLKYLEELKTCNNPDAFNEFRK